MPQMQGTSTGTPMHRTELRFLETYVTYDERNRGVSRNKADEEIFRSALAGF